MNHSTTPALTPPSEAPDEPVAWPATPPRRSVSPAVAIGHKAARAALDVIKARDLVDDFRNGGRD